MSMTPAEVIAKVGELPTLPHVATKVMKLLSDPNTAAKDLQEAIITDQSITVQILKISNSAMFGLKREVRTLTHAIMLLGFSTIRSIVIASATKGMHKGRSSMGLKEKLLWENSIGSALVARGIAENYSDVDKEEAFIGGLMHNIGQTILNNQFSAEYGDLVATSYNERVPIEFLERKHFGFDHAALGALVLKQWNLSETLCHSVLHYLSPQQAPAAFRRSTAIIALSCNFCLDLGMGVANSIPLAEQPNTGVVSQILGLSPERLDKWREIVKARLEKDAAMIQGL